MPAAGQRWRLVDPENTRIAWFSGEALVFNPSTWQTHLVNEAAGSLIAALKASPLAAAELAVQLGLDDAAQDMDDLADLLAELCELALVKPGD